MSDTPNQISGDFPKALRDEFAPDFSTRAPDDLETYGRDWTRVYPAQPSLIAFPRTTDEVARLLRLCSKHSVAVVPSGGRTGLAGGAVASNGEVVISLDRMNRMGPVDTLAQTVRVQAGAITEAVHRHCETSGLTWPVDFASKGSSQVGGNIATNAGGVKVIKYGSTRQWVLGLEVVTMDGTILELNGALEKNNTGADLKQLFIGSEGTLGVITEATLKLTRVPGDLDVFFFALSDMGAVLRLFLEARRAPFTLMAFETMSANCLEQSARHFGLKKPLETDAQAYVLMEVERPVSSNAGELLEQWLTDLFEKELVLDGTKAQSPREARELWMLREGVAEALYQKAFLHKNDIAVPVSELEPFVREMDALFRERHSDFEVAVWGHIGDGNLHINTLKPDAVSKVEFMKRCHEADQALFEIVRSHHGSVSAEHGIGLLKKDALHFTRTADELRYLRLLKSAFDPKGLLNPGKIFD
ncbi:MAG: FAD-linked oxidase [Bdellovibrionales bacterium GWB1_55_8]|nr:MAG: FAD-linked oxidase [Bdellovibrionales bacterium GWB1_55_8]